MAVIPTVSEGDYIRFETPEIKGTVTYDKKLHTFCLSGVALLTRTIEYWGANPLWRNESYEGSGLPYPNPEVAYDNSPNKGTAKVDSQGLFLIHFQHPSAYYVGQGKTLLKPHLHLRLVDQKKELTLIIGEPFPNRSLTGLPDRPNRTIGR